MKQNLNFSRQLVKDGFLFPLSKGYIWTEEKSGGEIAEVKYNTKQDFLKHFDVLNKKAIKFMLPTNGYVLDDPEYKAIYYEELHLPFPEICLEFLFGSLKTVLYATEGNNFLCLNLFACSNSGGRWVAFPNVFLKKKNTFTNPSGKDPYIALVSIAQNHHLDMGLRCHAQVLLSFLNVLACSNVEISDSTQSHKEGAKIKNGSIPFDSYKILTIKTNQKEYTGNGASPFHGGSSPREHLRRGHIRRLPSGLKIWVNSAIISAGSLGKVHKNYKVKK